MLSLAYTVTSDLKASLLTIDALREKVLLTSLSPKVELKMKWEASLQRIYILGILQGEPFSKKAITNTLLTTSCKGSREREIYNWHRAFGLIRSEWWVTNKPITVSAVRSLAEVILTGLGVSWKRFKQVESEMKVLLEYLEEKGVHPVIQAAIAYGQLINLSPFQESSEPVARLVAYLLLYKYGFDVRELVVFEKDWKNDPGLWKRSLSSVEREGNYNLWLLFFTQGLVKQLEGVSKQLEKGQIQVSVPVGVFELNERQKRILNLLERPEVSINNKKVQKKFKVSQITASRDLAKLLLLGLVFSHGRGRSVYYTRV